jgi:purine-nucleoside phosphorylase
MKSPLFTRADYEEAASVIRQRAKHQPKIGLILGSGLGGVADAVEDAASIPYAELPHWPHSKVVGHGNRAVVGLLENKPVMVLQGRSHFYEGYDPQAITFSVRVMQVLGVETLIVTNASGGIRQNDPSQTVQAGELMLISDHIYFPGLAGHNPLFGANDDTLGARFPNMIDAYDPKLRTLAKKVADAAGIKLHEGIYACVAGPNFETPAEVSMLRVVGAKAVGMSTAPEVVVARHGGIRVLGFSGVANVAADYETVEPGATTTHAEVLEATARIVPNLTAILRGVLVAL